MLSIFYKNEFEMMQACKNRIRDGLLHVGNTLNFKKNEIQCMKDKSNGMK